MDPLSWVLPPLTEMPLEALQQIKARIPNGGTHLDLLDQVMDRYDPRRGHDMESAIRGALTRALQTSEHRPTVVTAMLDWATEMACGQCGTTVTCTPYLYNGKRYCSQECRHDAGDRSLTCGHCGTPMRTLHFYNGNRYCSQECCHEAGDRSECRIGCGCKCTPWAIKRRQLRKSRAVMRIMEEVIEEHALDRLLKRRLESAGDLTIATDDTMDEGSDAEDPMVTQANEISNIDSIVQMSRNMVDLAEARRGLKRARDTD